MKRVAIGECVLCTCAHVRTYVINQRTHQPAHKPTNQPTHHHAHIHTHTNQHTHNHTHTHTHTPLGDRPGPAGGAATVGGSARQLSTLPHQEGALQCTHIHTHTCVCVCVIMCVCVCERVRERERESVVMAGCVVVVVVVFVVVVDNQKPKNQNKKIQLDGIISHTPLSIPPTDTKPNPKKPKNQNFSWTASRTRGSRR
jgi:hypothetical protein